MKKSLSIFLSVLLLISAVCVPGLASDYEGHWAKDTIALLISNGIVAGDNTGNVNPDAAITRAEFVKVINKTFRYTGKGADNFPDVSPSAWYADDMAIAKAGGYIQGDAEGNGNPENNITRTEVCVILARVLKLDTSNTAASFTDGDQIAEWGIGSVTALVNAGYLSGYPDGSFQGENSITRAEAFSVVGRYVKKVTPSNNNTGDVSSMGGSPSVSTGGGSGSGSGGGSSAGGKLSAPSISRMNAETEVLQWSKVSNASSYEVEVTVNGKGKTISVSELSVDLTDTVDALAAASSDSHFEVSARVRAVPSKSGYTTSDYSKKVTYTKTYPSVDAPKLSVANKTVNQKNRVVISIEPQENISKYSGRFVIGGVENNSMIYDETANVFIIPDTSVIGSAEAYAEIKAVSTTPGLADSAYTKVTIVDVPVSEGDVLQGTGTAEDPYRLRTKAHFEKVRSNSNMHFVVMNDIDLGEFTPIPAFSGTITSANGKKYILTVNINDNQANCGLFRTLDGGGAISNLILAGSVKGSENNVGGFVGSLTNGTIEGCINSAEVICGADPSADRRPNAGGIVGYAGTAGEIKDCINTGNITSFQSGTGGIIGQGSVKISGCANTGVIANTRAVGVAGIAGIQSADVENCYNSGAVRGPGSNPLTAGIVGAAAGDFTIRNCFNTAAITGNKQGYLGGILGGFYSPKAVTIENCYNAGTLSSFADGKGYGIGNPYDRNSVERTLTVSNCYYIGQYADGSGTKSLTAAELMDAANADTQNLLNAGYIFDKSKCDYPVLSKPEYFKPGELPFVPAADFSIDITGVYADGAMLLEWELTSDAAVAGIEFTVIDNYNFQTILDKQLAGAAETSLTVPNCKEQNSYEVIVRLKYGEDDYSSEKSFEISLYSENTLEKPVLSPVAEGTTTVNWAAVPNAASYLLKAVLGQTEETIPVSGTSYDLERWIAEKTAASPQAQTRVTVSVKAVAGSAEYSDSPYSNEIAVIRILPALSTPEAELRSRAVSGKNRVVIAVKTVENADSYEGKFVVGSAQNNTMEYDAANNLFIIPDTSVIGSEKAYVEIKAVSENPNLLDSAVLKVPVVHTEIPGGETEDGDGSAEKPFQLRSKDDFEKVRNNPGMHFVVMNDIDLGEFTPIPEFTGSITSVSGKKCILTVNMVDTTTDNKAENWGLFQKLNGGAKISNLVLAGKVQSARAKTGGFVGSLVNGTIEGCVNTAEIICSTDSARRSYAGGLVGYSDNGSSGEIKNCINTGNVTSYLNEAGGIIGRSYVKVSGCVNLGTIRDVRGSGVAGIAGLQGRASIENCYNAGEIIGSGAKTLTAGIAGYSATITIKNCFNTGKITGFSGMPVAGILGGLYNASYKPTLINCYNSGTLGTSSKKYGLAANNLPNATTDGTITATNCYYIAGTEDLTNSTSLTLDELADSQNESVKKLLAEGYTFDKSKCDYPVLSTLEYYKPGDLTFTPAAPFSITITGSFADGSLTLNLAAAGADSLNGMELTVYDGYTLEAVAEETLAADASSYTLNNTQSGHTYIAVCKAVFADGSKSEESAAEFTAE